MLNWLLHTRLSPDNRFHIQSRRFQRVHSTRVDRAWSLSISGSRRPDSVRPEVVPQPGLLEECGEAKFLPFGKDVALGLVVNDLSGRLLS